MIRDCPSLRNKKVFTPPQTNSFPSSLQEEVSSSLCRYYLFVTRFSCPPRLRSIIAANKRRENAHGGDGGAGE